MAKNITLRMEYLHSSNPCIIHSNIKPSNLLINNAMNIKVGDFGFATAKVDNAAMAKCRTPCWSAPETFVPMVNPDSSSSIHYNKKANMCSFRIILWQLVSLKRPNLDSYNQVINKIIGGRRPTQQHPQTTV